MHKKIPFQELKTAFYYILENFFKSLCIQLWRNTTIMWNTKWVRACLAIRGSQQSLCFPCSSCACEPQEQLGRDTLNTLILIWTTGTATKYSFWIVFKSIFRNANCVLWCYNPPLDLLCWVADSMSVTGKLVDLSIYKVPYRKTSLWQCSVFC